MGFVSENPVGHVAERNQDTFIYKVVWFGFCTCANQTCN